MSRAELPSIYQPESEANEQCGVTGGLSKSGQHVSHRTPIHQEAIQNRGQDTAGMATFNIAEGKLHIYRGLGLVKDVFPPGFDFVANNLISDRAIGHNRYATDDGNNNKDDITGVQPMLIEWKGKTLAVAYNGNLPDKERQKLKDRIPSNMPKEPNFDTADIGRAIVSAEGDSWEEKIENGLRGVNLAYSLTMLTDTGELFGLRCPAGTWPLWVGEGEDLLLLASETRVDASKDIKWREVQPGELVKLTPEGVVSKQIFPKTREFRCALHDMYGARGKKDDIQNIMTFKDGVPFSYDDFRREAGRNLAIEHPKYDADVIIGIPETGIPIAEGYAEKLGKQATTGVIEKLNGMRAFIGKNEEEIHAVISGSLVYITEKAHLIAGKKVVVVDDSFIRGKSAGGHPLNGIEGEHPMKKVKGYIDHFREMGAARIDALYALSKFVAGCDMGYYIRKGQLVALVKREDGTYEELTEKEMALRVGADSIGFLSLEGLQKTYESVFGRRDIACTACMGGSHPLDIIAAQPITLSPSLASAAAD